jgi:hypothetical protein
MWEWRRIDPDGERDRRCRVARGEARIFTSIWDDDAFVALSPNDQRMYLYLVSQPDLSFCGVLSLREKRWARDARGLTVDQVAAALARLAEPLPEGFGQPFLVIDEDTEEVFVRSLIRHDGIWKIPNLLKSARKDATLVASPRIKVALLDELRRIPAQESESVLVKRVHAEFVAELERACANPSRKGSDIPSGNPSANPSQGEGERNGSSERLSLSPDPFPPTPGEGSATAPDDQPPTAREEGEGNPQRQKPTDLVDEVRAIRPEWSERSIRRALSQPAVAERPEKVVRSAILAVANDPKSQAPGRLEHDGPWWRLPAPAKPPPTVRDEPWHATPPLGQRDNAEVNARGRKAVDEARLAARRKAGGGAP